MLSDAPGGPSARIDPDPTSSPGSFVAPSSTTEDLAGAGSSASLGSAGSGGSADPVAQQDAGSSAHTPATPPRTRLQTGKPHTVNETLADPIWKKAMDEEVHALHKNNTWHLIPSHPGKSMIDCKWVFGVKRRSDGTIERYKARLFAKGFKQREYATDLLSKAGLQGCKPSSTPLSSSEKLSLVEGQPLNQEDGTRYRSLVGALQYLTLSRPDISFASEKASWNYAGIFKLSNIKGKKREPIPSSALDGDDDMDSDSSSDEDDEEINEDAESILHLQKVAHEGSINRIRSMNQKPEICATWGDTGHVQVWDFSSFIASLEDPGTVTHKDNGIIHNHVPLKVFSGHKDEGYAIDWSPNVTGRLVSGDCNKCIHLWEPTSSDWSVDAKPFVGHSASVEDLQWNPTEENMFASCSVDGTIAIWDIRIGRNPCYAPVKVHNSDVNVISWNSLAGSLIASGCDDGSISVHDIRAIESGEPGKSMVAHFAYHKHPITSVEWSPYEASTLAVSSADNQLTIWDLSLERDAEEEAEFKAKMKEQANAPRDLPPQLLFVHQGQKDLKELHWHPQIPGMIISTAADGFNVLMPSNIDATIPSAGASIPMRM
ncbi:unnamed protein product [Triticum turgidum subsp. durum]|uniref:Histone-binding protein RBBP4 N-terminal domain-containing protein n=1 Tax=Triticum turgidum subsp. durum TaxID=4567 RepID=A0A9R0TR47_TRITD|nr:unnamed protein product [Triticum turgidum subsp. durum]